MQGNDVFIQVGGTSTRFAVVLAIELLGAKLFLRHQAYVLVFAMVAHDQNVCMFRLIY